MNSKSIYSTGKMIIYGLYFIAGITLVILSALEIIPGDSYWAGFGGGISGVAAVRLYLGIKYRNDSEYARKIDISNSDERTVFIANKSKSWAFYATVIGEAVAGSVLFSTGYTALGQVCYYTLCGMCLVYWITYMILNKKY